MISCVRGCAGFLEVLFQNINLSLLENSGIASVFASVLKSKKQRLLSIPQNNSVVMIFIWLYSGFSCE